MPNSLNNFCARLRLSGREVCLKGYRRVYGPALIGVKVLNPASNCKLRFALKTFSANSRLRSKQAKPHGISNNNSEPESNTNIKVDSNTVN